MQNRKTPYQGLKDRASRIKEWSLNRNDICMGKITQWLAAKFGLSLLPTQSRWGIVSILSSLALFFIALFPAVLAIYLSSQEGKMKEALLIIAIVVAGIAFLIIFFTASLSTHFLRNQKEDVLIKSMTAMQDSMITMKASMAALLPASHQELPLIRQAIKDDKPSKIEGKPSKAEEQTRFDILKLFMRYYGRYHNHKETMAWVATAFYVGGAVSVTVTSRGLACSHGSWQVAFTVLLFLAGVCAFLFVRWQFARRQEAADRVLDCYTQLLAEHNRRTPEANLNWPTGNTAKPRDTEWLSYIAIMGITVIALVLLNVC